MADANSPTALRDNLNQEIMRMYGDKVQGKTKDGIIVVDPVTGKAFAIKASVPKDQLTAQRLFR